MERKGIKLCVLFFADADVVPSSVANYLISIYQPQRRLIIKSHLALVPTQHLPARLAGTPLCCYLQEYPEPSSLVVLLFASLISHLLLPMPREPMFSLPVLTERVSSMYLQRTRMRAISPLELVLFRLFIQLPCVNLINSTTDMFGFKLELPQREDGITKKTRPIYLDMQVNDTISFG